MTTDTPLTRLIPYLPPIPPSHTHHLHFTYTVEAIEGMPHLSLLLIHTPTSTPLWDTAIPANILDIIFDHLNTPPSSSQPHSYSYILRSAYGNQDQTLTHTQSQDLINETLSALTHSSTRALNSIIKHNLLPPTPTSQP